ncbi:ABC transporter ATP-binding protein [Streptococcus marmotae]|uniref:ABC transporter ATP-binding protein n=1 Tax=Streptococcus marmotae TaxID=1825069 RepID=UPI00083548E0|nr:ABC transporter ATP-binding protein [Streptococcus marmotae]
MTDSIHLENLTIQTQKGKQLQTLVKKVSLTVPKGKILGIVGESGSGKSLTVKSMMGIQPKDLLVQYDRLEFEGKAVADYQHLPMAMIFQDPMTSLNPLRKIGYHLDEIIKRFSPTESAEGRKKKMVDMLTKVGISNPEQRLKQFPFEFSGGMRQRILIAMALLAEPKVLIADEPTTALDVTIQAQILALIKQLQESLDLTVIIVSHDFSVIAGLCDQVKVMREGQIVEAGTVDDIFDNPLHPYTQELLQAARLETGPTSDFLSQEKIDGPLVAVSGTHFVRQGGY